MNEGLRPPTLAAHDWLAKETAEAVETWNRDADAAFHAIDTAEQDRDAARARLANMTGDSATLIEDARKAEDKPRAAILDLYRCVPRLADLIALADRDAGDAWKRDLPKVMKRKALIESLWKKHGLAHDARTVAETQDPELRGYERAFMRRDRFRLAQAHHGSWAERVSTAAADAVDSPLPVLDIYLLTTEAKRRLKGEG